MMADERFDLIFRGDIVLGQPLAEVKQRLQQLFKADAGKVEKLFSGRPVALKRGLERATAEKYQQVLHKAGAQVSLVPSQMDAEAGSGSSEAPAGRRDQNRATGLSLAPAGGFLLNPSERPRLTPVSVDISGLSVRPAEGDLLDAGERSRAQDTSVQVPDFDLAEAGADLLSEEERPELPLMAIEPEDWGLAEAGSDLLSPEERGPVPEAPVLAADFELAPAGSDMGQLKPQQKPVSPDISGLRLEE